MKRCRLFFTLIVCFFAVACSGRGLPGQQTCNISAYSFKGGDRGDIILTFTDNLMCGYKLAPGTEKAWVIYTPNAYFANLTPSSDNYSDMNIRAVRRTEAGIEIYFTSPFDAYSRPHEVSLPGVEGYKHFVFKKKLVALPGKQGKMVTNMFCNNDPFAVRIDADGVAAYRYGQLGFNKSYIDILGSALADNFTASEGCQGVVKAMDVDFPPRVRFVIDNPSVARAQAYGSGYSVYMQDNQSPISDKGYYLLGMNEELHGAVQILRFYTSGKKPSPVASSFREDSFTVNTGGNFRPVSTLAGMKELNGTVFPKLEISKSGDRIIFSGAKKGLNAEFYLDKKDDGFAIYLKELNRIE